MAQKSNQLKNQAYGTSHNIFDVSSLGEVQMNNFNSQLKENSNYKTSLQTYDQTVSLVMQDSMQEDLKGGIGKRSRDPV